MVGRDCSSCAEVFYFATGEQGIPRNELYEFERKRDLMARVNTTSFSDNMEKAVGGDDTNSGGLCST